MIFGYFRSHNLSKNTKNGIFDLSVKSHINSIPKIITQLRGLKFGIIQFVALYIKSATG